MKVIDPIDFDSVDLTSNVTDQQWDSPIESVAGQGFNETRRKYYQTSPYIRPGLFKN